MCSRFLQWFVLLAMTTGAPAAWAQTSQAQDVAGKYVRIGSARVALNVQRTDGTVTATISGGGPPGVSGGAPADCMVIAEGTVREGRLAATFRPVETHSLSYGHRKGVEEKRQLIVVFSPGEADVERADTFGYCGLGIDFLGRYKKTG